FIVITDRKKDLIVTSGGKNVAPQPLEGLLKTSKYVTQAVVIGNKRNFISAIIVPNFENLTAFAKAAGISYHNETDLVQHPDVIKKIHDEIDRKSTHLAGFERVKKFFLTDRDFSIEADELTPTLKVKRRAIEKKFEREINAIYDS
ncbi:MAG: long-chain fatty acid--CoA ligase, partial [Candidatus Latescibacterota bacterium]